MKALSVATFVASAAGAVALAQDRSRPPALEPSAGRFSAVRLDGAPRIDGREWIATDVQSVSADGRVPTRARAFTLEARACGDYGDFGRCELFIRSQGGRFVRIDRGYTGWVYVTPDARYVITEPLYVLDVGAWKQYALYESLHIENYTNIEAVSRDGKRLFVSRQDCAMCRDPEVEYYEVRLP